MLLKVSTLVAAVATVVSLIWIKDLRLPYPSYKIVQSIPQEQIAAPSDLRGPYSINRHLQKARKLFEHQIDSAGTAWPQNVFSHCMQTTTHHSYQVVMALHVSRGL